MLPVEEVVAGEGVTAGGRSGASGRASGGGILHNRRLTQQAECLLPVK